MNEKFRKKAKETKPVFSLDFSDLPSPNAQVSDKTEQLISDCASTNKEKTYINLEPKLLKLKENVGKLFKKEFVDSLAYLIQLEYNPQVKFEANLSKFEWKQLDYLMQQMKKICKNKKHILTLIHAMRIDDENSRNQVTQKKNDSSIGGTNSENANENVKKISSNELIDAIYDYSTLINDADNSDGFNNDYFSLISIMIRFLYKLIKSTLNNEIIKLISQVEVKIIDLALVLLSCLADFSYHEEIRIQVSHLK